VQCSNEITITIIHMGRKFRGRFETPFNTTSPGLRPISMRSTILTISRLATINWGSAPFFGGGERDPHLTQRRLSRGLLPYEVASWSMQPLGHNGYGPKIGGCAPLGEEELGPHLIQCGQGRGLSACQVSSWSVKMFRPNTSTWQTDRTRQGRTDSQTDNGPIE